MPIRQRVERVGDVARRVIGLLAEALDDHLGGGQVIKMFRLNLGEHDLAGEVGGELFKLLADIGDSSRVITLPALGFGDGIKRLRIQLFIAAVVECTKRFCDDIRDAAAPENGQIQSGDRSPYHADERDRVIQSPGNALIEITRQKEQGDNARYGQQPFGEEQGEIIRFPGPTPENPRDDGGNRSPIADLVKDFPNRVGGGGLHLKRLFARSKKISRKLCASNQQGQEAYPSQPI